ncbi:MAG TPA: DUF4262 domain-containing protein [Planctomycetota bacterium]
MRETTADLQPSERQILDDVEEHGVHIVHVPERGERPPFSATVGLWHSFEQPEVIVFGMPREVAHMLLDAIADEASEGKTFLSGSQHDGLLQHYAVRFLDVPASLRGEYFTAAAWAYDGAPFSAVQLVWPDKQGRWPWSEGVREAFRECQPVLSQPERAE